MVMGILYGFMVYSVGEECVLIRSSMVSAVGVGLDCGFRFYLVFFTCLDMQRD